MVDIFVKIYVYIWTSWCVCMGEREGGWVDRRMDGQTEKWIVAWVGV
jgi:hypothetical protein